MCVCVCGLSWATLGGKHLIWPTELDNLNVDLISVPNLMPLKRYPWGDDKGEGYTCVSYN